MEIALFTTIILGLIAVLLSWELDKVKKLILSEKQMLDDRIYKISVLRSVSEKIAYTTDIERVIDIVMGSLRNFFNYSVASSMVIKNTDLLFKAYVEETVSTNYIKSVEEAVKRSLEKLAENLPEKLDKRIYGVPLNDNSQSTYASSFHVPLIVNHKVLALIHLSSTKENIYKKEDMDTLYEMLEVAATSLTHFKEALDTQSDKFTSLIRSINDGIFMADNKNNLLLINDSCRKILGIIRENISFFDVAGALPTLNLGSKINETVVNNKSLVVKEFEINGITYDIFINPVGNEKASVLLRDISEYKRKEALREDLTHVMVHELRSPITTIKDSSELIISTDNLEQDKKINFLRIIHQQAKKVLGQIGSILDTAKLDAGKLTLQKTKGDIAKLVKEEMEIFTPQAERKNISVKFNLLNDNVPFISFDSIRVAQVIDNLLSNALKFTPVGGKINIEVDYKAIPPKIDGSSPMGEFLSLDKYVVVSVSDTGVGIAKEEQNQLFTKYTQAKNAPEAVSKQGTGLGLYVVKGIVESHGGRVWVKSDLGQGTTFSFSLPATDDSKTLHDGPKLGTTPLAKLSQTIN